MPIQCIYNVFTHGRLGCQHPLCRFIEKRGRGRLNWSCPGLNKKGPECARPRAQRRPRAGGSPNFLAGWAGRTALRPRTGAPQPLRAVMSRVNGWGKKGVVSGGGSVSKTGTFPWLRAAVAPPFPLRIPSVPPPYPLPTPRPAVGGPFGVSKTLWLNSDVKQVWLPRVAPGSGAGTPKRMEAG
jgi:hypothetical protein